MSEKTTRKHLADRQRGGTDWKRIDATSDEQLERSIAADPDADVAGADWTQATLVLSRRKDSIHLRVDPEVLGWFRKQGKGYLTRMNAVLRAYYEAHRNDAA